MLKLLGLVMVFSCGVLCGFAKARSLAEGARVVGGWQELLRQFSVTLAGTRAAPREIIRMLAKQTAFTGLPGVEAMAEAFRQSGSFAAAAAAAGRTGAVGEVQ